MAVCAQTKVFAGSLHRVMFEFSDSSEECSAFSFRTKILYSLPPWRRYDCQKSF